VDTEEATLAIDRRHVTDTVARLIRQMKADLKRDATRGDLDAIIELLHAEAERGAAPTLPEPRAISTWSKRHV
jgi:hypothetical protein